VYYLKKITTLKKEKKSGVSRVIHASTVNN